MKKIYIKTGGSIGMGRALKCMREDKGMTQAELAKKSGVTLRQIQAFEMGYRDINKANVLTVLSLSEALECDIYEILNPRG